MFFSNVSISQNPTVISDSLVVMNRVYAKEKLIVDKLAVFKEDIKVQGSARVQTDLRVDGELRVDGTTKLNGNVKMENIGLQSSVADSMQILIKLPNGQIKTASFKDFLIAANAGPVSLDFCGHAGTITNPQWFSGVNKIFSPCPPVNVGIATDNPLHKLHVAGLTYSSKGFLAGNAGGSIDALMNAFGAGFQDLVHFGTKVGGLPETIQFTIKNTGAVEMSNFGSTPSLTIQNGTGHAVVINGNSGNKILQLEDNGLLRTREVRVDATNWPDYVFEKNYKLPSLTSVAKFIEKNNHLPGVPTAKEIETNGLNLGDMQNIQMQKIEELTLYLIEMDEKMIDMEKRMNELEKENSELKKSLK